jgi:hypothetical protein
LKETKKGAPVRPVGLPAVDLLETITLDIKAEAGKSGSRSAHCELWITHGELGVCTENLKSGYSGDEVRQGWRVNE